MKDQIKFATTLGIFGNQSDRWCNAGYKENKSVEELFEAASKVEGLDGIGAASESITWLKAMIKVVESVDPGEIEKVIEEGDAVKSQALMRKMLFK